MKGLILSALLAGGVVIAVTPVVSTVYGDAYPQDSRKRQALDFCVESEQGFNRLLATDRASCYQRYLPVTAPVAQPAPRPLPHLASATVNFVDLWRASSRGSMPQNDIRFQQQTVSVLQQMH